jgi:hypothetical protein
MTQRLNKWGPDLFRPYAIIEVHSDAGNLLLHQPCYGNGGLRLQPGCARKRKMNNLEKKPAPRMLCANCSEKTEVHLIDCCARLGTPERDKRYCPVCRPEYNTPGQRRFVVDRAASYPLAERIIDLAGPVPKRVM